MPQAESKPSRMKPAKPESCVHVLQRCCGWSLQQATDYAAKLSDADRAKIEELTQLPHHGNALRRVLDDVADRRNRDEGPGTRDEQSQLLTPDP